MELWVIIALVAATAQTGRFMLQKHLKATQLSTAGATFARFIYSAPLIAIITLIYLQSTGQSGPELSLQFWVYAVVGGLSQILATMCVVALFAQRNFAVGITFKKTEVILSVLVGFVILGDRITGLAFLAILIGLPGVLLLSDPPRATGAWHRRIFNRAAGLGVLSGVLFAFAGVGYRGASLSLGLEDNFLSAIAALAYVTAFQTATMSVWLLLREPGEIGKVISSWRISGLVGLSSMVGSACWFWAFTLQSVALVNAVGQVEMILSLLVATFIFKEKITGREVLGGALLLISILTLILVT